VPPQFNWCAYALDVPPTAVINAAGGYTLKGTAPFTINGTITEGTKAFAAGTCITTLTDFTGNPTQILPALPTVSTTNPDARCGEGAVTLTATAGGGITTTNTYTWVVDGAAVTTTTTSSFSPTVAVGSVTYSVTVTNANNCTSTAATGTITVYPSFTAGAITSGASTITSGSTAPTIASTTAASGGDGTIPYQWRRAGTSAATYANNTATFSTSASSATTGTHTFTRWAHDGACNTAWTQSSNSYVLTVNPTAITYTNCTTPSLTLGTVGFTSSSTYALGTQKWSSPVTVTYCNKTTYSVPTSAPYSSDCRSNGSYGNLFSWCMVVQYAAVLCPSPWRVPTLTDMQYVSSNFSSGWGGTNGGYCDNIGTLLHTGLDGRHWSSTEEEPSYSYYLYYLENVQTEVFHQYKFIGYTLRCVQ
jgi:hypothetical protein